MAVSAWALLTLQDGKDHLSVTGNEFDAVIEGMIDSATLAVEAECDRKLVSRTYTAEIYDGEGGLSLRLRQYPVTAVSVIAFLTSSPPDVWTDYYGGVATADYGFHIVYPTAERVAFRHCWIQRGSQNVRVTYTAGLALATVPRALKDAARIALKAIWDIRDKQSAGIASQSFPGGQTVVYDKDAFPRIFARLCAPYQRCAWV